MELNRRRYLATLGTTASALALAGCTEDGGDSGGGDANDNSGDSSNGNSDNSGGDSNSGNSNDGNSGDGGSNEQPDVEILNHEFYEEEFSSGVRGTAVNNTDSEISYVEATATFLDSEGTQIGEGLDNVSDLAAGREWQFECMFTGQEESRIEEYEVEVTTGF
ncbi:FxLYD domain-containing protein [Haloarchaeobius iranensis]|uniref:Uncharacterized protein n=1 Tax=Haloarchaeobius iranensis TaxID=996166 RepID=A0A1H0B8K8_9EURY|nr:FxLYD domain-containing protein [Haloarchaeobius iranensis]SDN41988.1 hypothetical protein SAMN05192554_13514 [Haloarchaeobius iranensis]